MINLFLKSTLCEHFDSLILLEATYNNPIWKLIRTSFALVTRKDSIIHFFDRVSLYVFPVLITFFLHFSGIIQTNSRAQKSLFSRRNIRDVFPVSINFTTNKYRFPTKSQNIFIFMYLYLFINKYIYYLYTFKIFEKIYFIEQQQKNTTRLNLIWINYLYIRP